MAIYRNGATGQISLYIMEPEEELLAFKFRKLHSPDSPQREIDFWTRKTKLTKTRQAAMLGLVGGYDIQQIEYTRNKEIL
jgi:hypothetical protein